MSDQVEAPAPATGEEETHLPEGKPQATTVDQGTPKTYKLKNGKTEKEVTEDELIELGRKGLSSDQRWQDAARVRKEVEGALERFQEDPDAFLAVQRKLKGKGFENKVEMAKAILKDELARRNMSPEERTKAETQKEIDELNKKRDSLKSEERESRVQAIEKQYESQWSGEIMTAIDKYQFPKNKAAVARVAMTAQKVFDAGLDPDWDACVRETKAQMQRELRDFIETADDDRLLGLLGDKLPKRVAKLLAEGMGQARQPSRSGQASQRSEPRDTGNRKAVDLDAWSKKVEEFGK